ncbi:MAG TPA: T9SS type A sorting domain-containing protein [Bacteroidia bacterium]|jgi:hypothetical protein|nr:T9SS type A sorting domain-containing protein [Bacteroidia bacterium]
MKHSCVILSFLLIALNCFSKTYKVGSTKTYTLPSQVAGLVSDGDTVDIDAGAYSDCATWNKNNLLLRGIGGMAHIKDVVCSGKGIWNFNGNNITTEYIEFSGAANPDANGAGIRGQGGSFTVKHCYFHDNENGILCNDPVNGTSDVLVEFSEFANNGKGDGYSHNMYIGTMKNFTLRYCYTHHAKIGHEIKSRAQNNYILYNRITDEATGTASRNIDLPNGGSAIIIGNVIEQGANTDNSNLIGYGLEGLSNPAPQNIFIVNNTIINDRSGGSFVNIQSGTGVLKMVNNIFAGSGTLISGTATTLDTTSNFVSTGTAIGFVNASNYDYQLLANARVIGKGSNPGTAGSYPLTAVSEYVHNSNKRNRPVNGTIDIGAYEYAPATAVDNSVVNTTIMNVFPNPVSSTLSISTFTNGTVKIIDARGCVLFSKETEYNYLEIEMEKEAPGIYIVAFTNEEGTIYKKIVKE